MINEILDETRETMSVTLSVYEQNLLGIRGNRASIGLVDQLMIEYYGQQTPLRQLANLSTPEPMTITIRPFDPGAVSAIETAIQQADLGVNPNTDSGIIRLNMPALTRERRVELVKFLGKRTEDAKVSIRNIRRNAISDIKDFEKEGEVSEDESRRGQDEVQKLTDEFVKKIDEAHKVKEKDIMEI